MGFLIRVIQGNFILLCHHHPGLISWVKAIFIAFAQSAPIAQAVGLIITEAAFLIIVSVLRPWMDRRPISSTFPFAAINFPERHLLTHLSDAFGQPAMVAGVMVSSSRTLKHDINPCETTEGSFIKSQSALTTELDALGATARGDGKGGLPTHAKEIDDTSSSESLSRPPTQANRMSQQNLAACEHLHCFCTTDLSWTSTTDATNTNVRRSNESPKYGTELSWTNATIVLATKPGQLWPTTGTSEAIVYDLGTFGYTFPRPPTAPAARPLPTPNYSHLQTRADLARSPQHMESFLASSAANSFLSTNGLQHPSRTLFNSSYLLPRSRFSLCKVSRYSSNAKLSIMSFPTSLGIKVLVRLRCIYVCGCIDPLTAVFAAIIANIADSAGLAFTTLIPFASSTETLLPVTRTDHQVLILSSPVPALHQVLHLHSLAPLLRPNAGSPQSSGIRAGALAGIVIGILAVLAIIAAFFLFRRRQRKRDKRHILHVPATFGDGSRCFKG
ncbi:hypothetical protein MRB53_038896 [Persea americana]|nr:hypothetical protein MRB53_038896 [Persea americana]